MREELVEAMAEFRLRRRDRPWFIPIRLDDCELPAIELGAGEMLADPQYVDVFDPEDAASISRLITALKTR